MDPDVPEPEDRRPVRDDRDRAPERRVLPHLLWVRVDLLTDRGHARRVDLADVPDLLNGDEAPHGDLPAAVNLEDRVPDLLNDDPVEPRDPVQNGFELCFVVQVQLEIPHDVVPGDPHADDVADPGALLAERTRELTQEAGLVANPDPEDPDPLLVALPNSRHVASVPQC